METSGPKQFPISKGIWWDSKTMLDWKIAPETRWGWVFLPNCWFQPLWKICSSNWIIFPSKDRDEHENCLKPPTRYPFQTWKLPISNRQGRSNHHPLPRRFHDTEFRGAKGGSFPSFARTSWWRWRFFTMAIYGDFRVKQTGPKQVDKWIQVNGWYHMNSWYLRFNDIRFRCYEKGRKAYEYWFVHVWRSHLLSLTYLAPRCCWRSPFTTTTGLTKNTSLNIPVGIGNMFAPKS